MCFEWAFSSTDFDKFIMRGLRNLGETKALAGYELKSESN